MKGHGLDLDVLARQWVRHLPGEFVVALAAALREGPEAVAAVRSAAVLAQSQTAATKALAVAHSGEGPYLAGLLIGYRRGRAEAPSVTPVWTGPTSDGEPVRLTVAVVADLIATAREEIVLASYATVPGEAVESALVDAAGRGVEITLVLERPQDNPGFAGQSDPLGQVAARRLHWPADARPKGASLHAKVLVVDRRLALVGSANLTGAALQRNLECGLLVEGGAVPRRLAEHLLTAEELRPLS